MNKLSKKLLLLVPVITLTACGYGLKEIYDGSAYNSPVFEENYYRVHNEDLKEGSKKISSSKEYRLDKTKDYVFTRFDDSNFKYCEKDSDKYTYDDFDDEVKNLKAYSKNHNLSNQDSSFRYGYISKLFDGKMFCNGKFQIARLQMDEKGFSSLFEKEVKEYDYFAMNFKGALDYTTKYDISKQSKTKIDLHVSFFMKDGDSKFNKLTVSYEIDNIPTNPMESHSPNSYVFFGFKFTDRIDISRCAGISVTYDLLEVYSPVSYKDDNGVIQSDVFDLDKIKSEGLDHSLMLYEIFMPNSTWH